MQNFLQLYVIEFLGLLTGLGQLELQHLIYPRVLTGFGMLVFFTNLSIMEFQVRYISLFLLFSVIDGFKWFWMASIQLMLEFPKAPFLILHFWYYIWMTFLMILSMILLFMMMILLSILTLIRHLISDKNLNLYLSLNLVYKTLCMKYCSQVWAGAPSCFLELLEKLQKRICRTTGPSFVASVEPLAHCRSVVGLSLLCRY